MTTHSDTARVQYLNAADRLMLVAHDGMRKMGHPGFQCQTHVWLNGRLDIDRFRAALEQLQRLYPVIVSRLERDGKRAPRWRFDSTCKPNLVQHDLPDSHQADVWRYAETLFETPMNLDQHEPIKFHLLHRPDGNDVLILRFSHVLMDGKGPEFTLSEINRLYAGKAASELDAPPAPPAEGASGAPDEMAEHLLKIPGRKRFKAAMQVVRSQIKRPIRSAVLARGHVRDWAFGPLRICVRQMDEAQTQAAQARVRRLCGFPNLAPAALASVFRAIHHFSDKPIDRRTGLKIDLPLNLRAPGRIQPVFRNYMSFIQMSARPSELTDADALTKSLSAYMRDQLRRGVDVGTIQMMSIMAKMEPLLARHLLDRMRKDPISLGFGFLGPVHPGLETFCERPVEWLYSLNASISPPGMVLQVNQFRGRLNLVMTYIGSKVPDELANQFAEFIMHDLTAPHA